MTTKRLKPVKDNYDGPWKVYFRENLPHFLAFADVDAYDEIDWSQEVEFLDKEFRRISRGSKNNFVIADCLVKVRLKSGIERWILIHIELQAQEDETFPRRMFIYNVRPFDLYDVAVASYAVLADENANWKPDSFTYGFGKSETSIRFGVVKFTDYIGREKELEESDNPFALAILVHLKTLQTKGDPLARFNWKLRLSRILFTRGWERRVIESLFGFIDWIMRLPQELEDRFEAEIEAEEEDEKVELMSPREKKWLKMGKMEGKLEGKLELSQEFILEFLTNRFESIPEEVKSSVLQLKSVVQTENLFRFAMKAATLAEFEDRLKMELSKTPVRN